MSAEAADLPTSEPVTIHVSEEIFRALQEIAQRRGVDVSEALKEALGQDLFLLREIANGSKVLVKRPGRTAQQLVANGG